MINILIKHIKKFTFKRKIDLNKSQWWSLDRLNDFQDKRLRSMIKYVYENIPGYRRKFDKAKRYKN